MSLYAETVQHVVESSDASLRELGFNSWLYTYSVSLCKLLISCVLNFSSVKGNIVTFIVKHRAYLSTALCLAQSERSVRAGYH